MYEVLAESQIVINRHGPIAQGYSVNYRMFEATGMGALLLTEESLNIAELFEPNREILTYSSVEDLLEKIDFARANPDALRSIARAGQQKTLGTHTFANRARAVHNLLERKLGA
jgi:spore maturation protein CgeB